jgi:hypothetical protein
MKEERANEIAGDSDAGIKHGSDNGPGSPIPQDSQSRANERSGSPATVEDTAEQSLRMRKNGGPLTPEGKQRSKHNALKHGIFSKNVLLQDESRSEFNSLLRGLRNDLRPEGTLEELLVEKLAALAWRLRRLLLAERAQIQENTEAEKIVGVLGPGLIRKIQNPNVLERCLELLAELRKQVEKDSYTEYYNPILAKIYGIDDKEKHSRGNLYDPYREWVCTSKSSGEEQGRGGHATSKKCRLNVLYEIDQESGRLRRYQQVRASLETTGTPPEVLRHNVPDAPTLDRLLRYEASLERSFDRTLSQLERLQRMRLGQPVLPKLEVHHSMSRG